MGLRLLLETGSQSVEGALGFTQNLSSTTRFWMMGWGGVTVLGAIDSLPVGLSERPEDEGTGDAGQGVSEGPRYYDYGPGSNFGVTAIFSRNNRPFTTLFYEGRHLFSLDGVRANHFLQRGRIDLMLPLKGAIGAGVTGEYFDRRTFYQDAAKSRTNYHYPQVRFYMTWRLS